MSVVVRVLGPLEVVCDGRPVTIQGGKERVLLVRLALQAGRSVPAERLVEALWEGGPPPSAEASLRVLVSRVRKAFAAAGTAHAIGTVAPGYILAADEVDVARFEALSARGRVELADGRPVQAAATLAEALALWRGDQLAEVGSAPLQAEADRLEEARVTALEARIDADLASGRHRDVLGELRALCRAHPLREHLRAQLITALYRCGRQADALAAYQDLRRTLSEDLGIDPSPALQRLEAAVLDQSRALDPPPAPRTGAPPAPGPPPDGPEPGPLVGRDPELRVLVAAWAAASDGRSRVALVSGEAGIGKSRLLRELARHVRDHAGIVLRGRCDEDLTVPYQPFVECLGHLRPLVELAPGHLSELVRMVPTLAEARPGLPAPPPAPPDVERHRLFTAVAALLTALGGRAPVLLVLDDLHWADRPTLQLVRHLTGLDLGRVLVVGAHRDDEHPDGPLVEMLGAVRRDATIIRVVLRGVARRHVASLTAATVGWEPDAAATDLAHRLHDETGGNPFYLTEMLRHLVEVGVITAEPDGGCTAVDVATTGLPDSVREVLRARIARLGPDTRRVLAVAAVVGQDFELDVLAAASGLDEDVLLDLLETAARTALITETAGSAGRFRFAHALVQQTLYGDIGATRRGRLHTRVATAMDSTGGREPGELAHHYMAGRTRATTPNAIYHARAAAVRAGAASAPDEAVHWYGAVVDALPARGDREHARALIDLGVAQRLAGHPVHRDTVFAAADVARRSGADDLLVAAALAGYRGGFSRLGEVDTDKVALLESALEVCAPDTPERAQLLATLAGELAWHPDHRRRIALADEAVAVARRSGDAGALLYAIMRPVPADWVPERSAVRVRRYREALELADRRNDPTARNQAVHTLAQTLMERAAANRLDDAVEESADRTDVREPFLRWVSVLVRAGLAITRGDLDSAEVRSAEMLRIGLDGGLPDARLGFDQLLSVIRWHQGRLAEVLPGLRATVTPRPQDPVRWAGLVLAEAVCGDRDRASTTLRAASDDDFDLHYGASWLGSLSQWALVAVELEDEVAAAALYARLRPWQNLFATSGPLPVHGVSHCLARLATLLGRSDAAAGHFADAWHIHRRMRAPFYTAETCLHWARFLGGRDPDRAATLLAEARDLGRRHGFAEVARRCEDALTTVAPPAESRPRTTKPASARTTSDHGGAGTRTSP